MHRLTVSLAEVPTVTASGAPVSARVRIRNLGEVPLGGEITVGGPTGDIAPLSPTVQPFQVEAGQSVEIGFEFTFAATAVRGEYPLHAFVEIKQGGAGVLRVARTVRVDFPSGSATSEPIPATQVQLPPLPGLTGLNGLLEQWRLEALAEYVRTEDEPTEGSIFRLGNGKEDFRVAVIPGDQGLLDGWFLLVGPKERIYFHGVRLEMNLPGGVLGPSDDPALHVEVAQPVQSDGQLAFEHFLSCGEWTTMVRIEVTTGEGGLRIRAISQDEITSFGLGPGSDTAVAITGGRGLRVQTGEGWTAVNEPDFLEADHAAIEFPGGLTVLASTSSTFRRLEVAPSTRSTRIEVGGGDWLTLEPGLKTPYAMLLDSEKPVVQLPAALQGLWLDLDVAGFGATLDRLSELDRYDSGKKGVILRNWTAYGTRPRHPDHWPPDESLGSLADFLDFTKAANRLGLTWALDDPYSDLSPLAEDFDYDSVAFSAAGLPLEGTPGHYLLRPDRVQPFLTKTLQSLQATTKPPAVALGKVDSLASGYHDRRGAWHPPAEGAAAWRQAIDSTRQALGGDALVLVRADGNGTPTNADGVILPATETSSTAQAVPWPLAKRVGILRPPVAPGARGDLLTLLSGEGIVATHRDWGREMVRRAWFLRPVVEAMSGTPFSKIEPVGDGHKRLRCAKGESQTMWTNWAAEPWTVDEVAIAPWGFRAISGSLSARLELKDGRACELLEAPGVWYVNASGEVTASARPVDCRIRLDMPGEARVEVEWACSKGLPFGTKAVLVAYPVDQPRHIAMQVELATPVPSVDWNGRVMVAGSLPLRDIPIAEFAVAAALVTPSGRPISVHSTEIEPHGPFGGFAARLGKLRIERIEDGEIQEIAFGSEVTPEDASVALPAMDAPLVDVGWAQTNGGFRLERSKGGFRLIPLPDSRPFDIVLRPEALGFALADVVGMITRDLYGAGWGAKTPPVADGELRWKHDPRIFAYDLLLK